MFFGTLYVSMLNVLLLVDLCNITFNICNGPNGMMALILRSYVMGCVVTKI